MKVTEVGRNVYLVQGSESPREVNMGLFEGNGFCSCWPFAKQIRPQLEEHLAESKHRPFEYVPEARHQCPHIQAVNSFMANKLVQTIRKNYPDDEQPA